MKLSIIALAAVLTASQASACAFDFMPGYMGHGYEVDTSIEEAEAARKAALDQARRAFLARHNLVVDDAEAPSRAGTLAQVSSGAGPADANSSAEPRQTP